MTEKETQEKSGFDLDTFDVLGLDKQAPRKKTNGDTPTDVDPTHIINLVLRKIKKNDSFLTFSNQISEVNNILKMKYASANDIAQVILNDVSLTSKLLKLVNSSFYSHFSPDGISTISEAMIIVGTDQVKFLAASLKLIELMQNLGDSNLLKSKILKSLKRGFVADQVAKKGGFIGSEKLQVSSILYDFGEYLVTAFAPKTHKKILFYKDKYKVSLDEASKAITGISYTDLGILVANKWNMPTSITKAMKPITNYQVKKDELGPEDFLPFVCSFSDTLCDIDPKGDKNAAENQLEKLKRKYGGLFDISSEILIDIIVQSEEQIAKQATLLNISEKPVKIEITTCIKDKALIEKGIKEIRQTLESKYKVQEIFEMALKYLSEGFRFTNINFCIKNKQANTMNARYVLGSDKDLFLKHFKFNIIKSGDLFNQSLHKGTINIVEDISDNHYNALLPLWFKKKEFSTAFAVVPIGLDNKIVSMLYLDWNPDQVNIDDETKSYLDVFRSLIVQALKR
ncbi:MAG: HDOD domain-containing protein [Desulfobacterales bacterium]|nr:HDOD domain-containing protein [Desulfobacterales bacterium]